MAKSECFWENVKLGQHHWNEKLSITIIFAVEQCIGIATHKKVLKIQDGHSPLSYRSTEGSAASSLTISLSEQKFFKIVAACYVERKASKIENI